MANYKPFMSKWEKNGETLGWNYMGIPKENFKFQSKIYVDLPIPKGNQTFTFNNWHFISLNNDNVLYGVPPSRIKQNNQMENCANFYLSKDLKIPFIDLTQDVEEANSDKLFDLISSGMKKTKEYYEKNPPLPVQNPEIKVFETTVSEKSPDGFIVNNLTNKYFDGSFTLNGVKYAMVHFPFQVNERILVPFDQYKDNENGSFSLNLTDKTYLLVPCKNLKEISTFDFNNKFREAFPDKQYSK